MGGEKHLGSSMQGYFIILLALSFVHGDHAPVSPYHAPVVHAPAYHAPLVHAAPAYHAPVHHAPVVHAAPAYHAPVVHAAPAYHAPAPVYKEEPAPYQYEYGVHDEYSGASFGAAETSDGTGNVDGSYSVNLPDGRIQHVNYHADHYGGYVADVKYEGVPAYAQAPHPAPAYPTSVPYHG